MDATFFAEIFQAQLAQLHTAFPARVESFDATTQTVDVTPQLKTAYPDGEGGFTHKAMPVIPNVPVCFPRAGSFFLSFPLAKGDFVLVVVCDRSLQAWRDKGQAIEPGDLATHPLDGAVAIPGVYPASGALDDVSASTMKLGKDGAAAAQIEITASGGKLGANATKEIARKGDGAKISSPGALLTWMQAVEGFINGLVPGTVATLAAAIAAIPGIEIKDGSGTWKAQD
jgi:hypothetical protein